MSEYELADMFLTYGNFLQSTMERFIALLFAFLIASYLVSAKLTKTIVVIVLALYSYMALQYTFFFYNVAGDQVALAALISELRESPGSSLGWLEIYGPGLATVWFSQAAAMIISYVASIVFFFHTRRHPRQ